MESLNNVVSIKVPSGENLPPSPISISQSCLACLAHGRDRMVVRKAKTCAQVDISSQYIYSAQFGRCPAKAILESVYQKRESHTVAIHVLCTVW